MIKNIIIIILILGFVAVVVFLDVPGVQSVLNLKKDINIQKQTFVETQELVSKIENLTKSSRENKESVEKTSYILPDSEDIPNLIVQLEALAFEQGLILEKIEFTPIKQESENIENYQILSVNIRLIGSYPGLKNFLKAVEENMRLMDISSINFSTPSEESLQIFEFDLSLNTYYQ
jgi:Tfp pilus assembly protein PilO